MGHADQPRDGAARNPVVDAHIGVARALGHVRDKRGDRHATRAQPGHGPYDGGMVGPDHGHGVNAFILQAQQAIGQLHVIEGIDLGNLQIDPVAGEPLTLFLKEGLYPRKEGVPAPRHDGGKARRCA